MKIKIINKIFICFILMLVLLNFGNINNKLINNFTSYVYAATEYSSGTVTISQSGDYIIHNGVTKVIVTGEGVNANIVLDNVTINGNTGSTGFAPIRITNGATANIVLQGDNTLTGGYYLSSGTYYGYAGLQVDKGAEVVISGTGTLTATGGATYSNLTGDFPYNGAAGIGGGNTGTTTSFTNSNGYTAGKITINGGTITAIGGCKAAGIGGGTNGAATDTAITINGGTITAKAGNWAAGIGDGDSYSSDVVNAEFSTPVSGTGKYSIIINGGTVNATGGCDAAGIGVTDEVTRVSGNNSALDIQLLGGIITAIGGQRGAWGGNGGIGIGAGSKTTLNNNSITISSRADLTASSMGNFAIDTDLGSSGTVVPPKITVDNAGYTLILRFPNQTTSSDRVLTLYDENGTKVKEIEVKANYTTIATTVPTFGNYYLDFNGENILVTVEEGGGVVSGSIDTNDNSDSEIQTNNKFYPDTVSDPLTNIQVFYPGTEDSSIVLSDFKFAPKVKLYNIYVEYGATEADIKIDWEIPDGGTTLVTVDRTAIDTSLTTTTLRVSVPQDGTAEQINIVKQDTHSDISINSTAYTLNIYMVEKREINIADLTKIYDKQKLSPSITNSEDEIPVLDRKDIVYSYYDLLGNKLLEAPTDCGTYIVKAYLNKGTYIAEGEKEFTISKRKITIDSVEQFTKMEDGTTELSTSQKSSLGTISYSNVVNGDIINMTYNKDTSCYEHANAGIANKITLYDVTIDNTNYEISSTQVVYGEIVSGVNKAIFTSIDENTIWNKTFGTQKIEDCNTHSIPIRARSVNPGSEEVKYAVDIEWGDMIFSYSSSEWDTENHEYSTGAWSGMNTVNNKINVVNRSNRDINLSITATVDFIYEQSGIDIGFSHTNTTSDMLDSVSTTVPYKENASVNNELATYVMVQSDSVPPTSNEAKKIGTITVNISK